MGEMTFKDAAERYGPAVALILALVLLVTLLPDRLHDWLVRKAIGLRSRE